MRRRTAYRLHGEPLARTVFEREVRGDWELRGRGARKARLRAAVEKELREHPEVYDTSYRTVMDTLRIKYLTMLTQDWIDQHRNEARPVRHLNQSGIPDWLRRSALPISAFREHGRRWTVALVAAADRIIAERLKIGIKTVRKRRRGPSTRRRAAEMLVAQAADANNGRWVRKWGTEAAG